jgi:hypothetical protein
MTRSGFRKRISLFYLLSLVLSVHIPGVGVNPSEIVLLSCGLLLYGIYSSPRSVAFSHQSSAFVRRISFV